jgi:DNA-binding CsgD family transcriptional regulator
MNLKSREQRLVDETMQALHSSLELPEVLPAFQGAVTQLVPADYMAICVSKPGRPTEYDWTADGVPAAFFAHYAELAAHDFVRGSVVLHPNQVMRDTEMLTRKELERSTLYRRCHELGMPVERVMSVMLDMKQSWHAGLTMYRESSRAFTARDRAILQHLTPHLARAIRNCRMFHDEALGRRLSDSVFQHQGLAYVVLTPAGAEVRCTPNATPLLEKWFTPSERGPSGVPTELLERLAFLEAKGGNVKGSEDIWERFRESQDLRVTFARLFDQAGRHLWMLMLEEHPYLPAGWPKMTLGQDRVLSGMLRGWDNPLIASELGIAKGTVKKFVQQIFRRLEVDSRLDLILRAARLRWRGRS